MNLVRLPLTIGFGVARRVGGLGVTVVRTAASAAGVTDRGKPASRPDGSAAPPARPTGAAPAPPVGSSTPVARPGPQRTTAAPQAPSAPPAPAPGEAGALRPPDVPPGARPSFRREPPQPPPAGEESTRVHEAGDPGEPGPEIHVEGEPFPGYDKLRANEIVDRVRDADDSTKARVRLYEGAGKGRKTVLEATK